MPLSIPFFAMFIKVFHILAFVIFHLARLLEYFGYNKAACYLYLTATRCNPSHSLAWYKAGVFFGRVHNDPSALACYNNALAGAAVLPQAFNNRGVILQQRGEIQRARADFTAALAINDSFLPALINLGLLLKDSCLFVDALQLFDQALALDPANGDARLARAFILLTLERYQEGWTEYEWRFKFVKRPPSLAKHSAPWLGTPSLAGKRILFYNEQGLGDAIQFLRYLPLLAPIAGEIIVLVDAPLMALFRGQHWANNVLICQDWPTQYDYHCSLSSLPFVHGTTLLTIPFAESYIQADNIVSAKWRQLLGHKQRRRIGLVWSGSATHQNDRNRSLPLAALVPYLPEGHDYYGLQTEIRHSDQAALHQSQIRWLGQHIADFSDTAAICDHMDLIISVDTSVAHLAGAMGRPLLILLPFVPDFRWHLARSDSPWYASATLLRQPAIGDWTPVLVAVHEQLAALLRT